MSTHSYDPANVVVNIGGHIAGGFADGTFVNVSRNNQTWTLTSGADGSTARSKSNDMSGTLEITLMQTSATNNFLSAKHAADELDGSGKFAIHLLDANGTTLLHALEAWVQQAPSVEYGKELSDRTWTIETGSLIYDSVGGVVSVEESTRIKKLADNLGQTTEG